MKKLAWWLVLIGALNWGLVGLGWLIGGGVNWNLVHLIFGGSMILEAIVYILVGVSAVVTCMGCKSCKTCSHGETKREESSSM